MPKIVSPIVSIKYSLVTGAQVKIGENVTNMEIAPAVR